MEQIEKLKMFLQAISQDLQNLEIKGSQAMIVFGIQNAIREAQNILAEGKLDANS